MKNQIKNTIKMKNQLCRFYRTASKLIFHIPNNVHDAIIGSMLGDLFAERLSLKRNTRLQFIGGLVNKPYIIHWFTILQTFCIAIPKEGKSWNKRRKTFDFNIKFWTRSLACFNIYHELFYKDGVKIIPVNLIDLLTPIGLAYWAMDDGYNTSTGFYFCTDSYTYAEHLQLQLILKEKFNIITGIHVHGNTYRLYIHKVSKEDFFDLIRPHVIPHFLYKTS